VLVFSSPVTLSMTLLFVIWEETYAFRGKANKSGDIRELPVTTLRALCATMVNQRPWITTMGYMQHKAHNHHGVDRQLQSVCVHTTVRKCRLLGGS
jgi:hypothetical protein